jgi:hypothetical protein
VHDVPSWLYDELSQELRRAGHSPDSAVWDAAVALLPGWTGTIRSLHACAHLSLESDNGCGAFGSAVSGVNSVETMNRIAARSNAGRPE